MYAPLSASARGAKRVTRSRVAAILSFLTVLLLLAALCSACGQPASAASPSAQHTTRNSLPSPVPCPNCWHPALNTSWQWQLSGTVDQSFNVTMYDIDMFNNSAQVVASLHSAGRIVICYIDAGTWEPFRPDAKKFPDSVKGKPVSGFRNERWLDI